MSIYTIAFLIVILIRSVIEVMVVRRFARVGAKPGTGRPTLFLLVVTYAASVLAAVAQLQRNGMVQVAPFVVGITLLVGGYAGRVVTLRAMRGAYSLFVEPRGASVVTAGPYSVIRHPIYAFYVIEMVGILFIGSNVICAFSLLICGATCIYRSNREEIALVEKFGDEYTAYKRRTKKFIPYIL